MALLHSTIARRGGRVRSRAKTLANRAKVRAYWRAVRAGKLAPPRHANAPPPVATIAAAARRLCPRFGVSKLELYGSAARGDARRGSDVDLIASFDSVPGLRLIEFAQALEKTLGVSADVLDAETLAHLTNPYRLQSINADRRVVYEE